MIGQNLLLIEVVGFQIVVERFHCDQLAGNKDVLFCRKIALCCFHGQLKGLAAGLEAVLRGEGIQDRIALALLELFNESIIVVEAADQIISFSFSLC